MEFKPPDATGWIMDSNINSQNEWVHPPKKILPICREVITLPKFQGILCSDRFNQMSSDLKYQSECLVDSLLGDKARITQSDSEHICYLVNSDGVLIACVSLISDDKMGAIMMDQGWKNVGSLGMRPDGIFLYNLCVHRDYQHQGLGCCLVSFLIQKASSGTQLRCQVDTCNTNSLQLFRRLGFLPEARITNSSGVAQINLVFWID